MIVYLAGKIKDDPNYKSKFERYKDALEKAGHMVLNPAVLPYGMDDRKYMPICLAMLEQADGIFLIDDYKYSAGANLEMSFAAYQGKTIMFSEDLEK